MSSMRMTGLISGMDTESMVKQLISGHQMKVDDAKKAKTKIEWKKEAWSGLNQKIYSFYTGALSTFRSASTYKTKTATTTDATKATIKADAKAVEGTHTLSIGKIASAAYLTGTKIGGASYTATSYVGVNDASKKLGDLFDKKGENFAVDKLNGAAIEIGLGDEKQTIKLEGLTSDSTIADIENQLNTKLQAAFGVNDKGEAAIKVSLKNGGLSFINQTATVTEADGKKTYSEGKAVTIKAVDKESAAALGVTEKETKLQPLTEKNKNNSATAGSIFHEEKITPDSKVNGDSRLLDLGIENGTVLSVNGKDITVTKDMTLHTLATELSNAGINASYDNAQGRFFLSSKKTGAENDFTLTLKSGTADTIEKLGLSVDQGATKIDASNAIVYYNGAKFEQDSNAFSLNGLSVNIQDVTCELDDSGNIIDGTDNPLKITVTYDSSEVFESVKNFVKEYNDLIKEMNTLYSAERVKDYEPLTDEEKESMSDDQIEKWEGKIKDSLLRRDPTISSLLSSMRTILNKAVEYTDASGKTTKYSLSSLGITTGNYTENGKLHIQGDKDDPDYAAQDNLLMKVLQENPEIVANTLSKIGTEMYTNLQTAMKRTELSSALTFYNDKQYDTEIKDWDDKVKKLTEKMSKAEDRFYDQFSAMESAMAKMQSQQNYLSQLMGS